MESATKKYESWYENDEHLAPKPCHTKQAEKQYVYYRAIYEGSRDHSVTFKEFVDMVEILLQTDLTQNLAASDILQKEGLFKEYRGKRRVDMVGPGYGYRWTNKKLDHLMRQGFVERTYAENGKFIGYKIASKEHYLIMQKHQYSRNKKKKEPWSIMSEGLQSLITNKSVSEARSQGYAAGRIRKKNESLQLILCMILTSTSTLALVLAISHFMQ